MGIFLLSSHSAFLFSQQVLWGDNFILSYVHSVYSRIWKKWGICPHALKKVGDLPTRFEKMWGICPHALKKWGGSATLWKNVGDFQKVWGIIRWWNKWLSQRLFFFFINNQWYFQPLLWCTSPKISLKTSTNCVVYWLTKARQWPRLTRQNRLWLIMLLQLVHLGRWWGRQCEEITNFAFRHC